MPDVAGTQKVKNHPGIYRYKLASGKMRYAAVATFQGAQKWTRGHLTTADAESAKTAELARLKRDTGSDADPRMTLREFLEQEWLPSLEITPGSLRNYTVAVKNIVACIGEKRLKLLNDGHIEDFKQWMRARKLADNTRSRTYGRLNQALEYARRRHFIEVNPCMDIKAPPKGKYHAPLLTMKDIGRLLEAAYSTRYGLMIYMPIVTGLRESELYGAQWSNLDFATGRLTVIGKGDKRRSIILDPGTMDLLQQHRYEQMKRYATLDAPPPPYLFVSPTGKRWTQSNFYETWNAIRVAALIKPLHFHDMRHVHSTLGSQNGVPIKVMQQRLGHDDATITLNIYTDAEIEEQRPAAQKIATAVRAAFNPLSKRLAQEE